ncbi:helix-hairpin-helix domain-containing protein [Lactobacillus sp. ESL0680]|uniref:helix-hairpin-helix domain-containing protein n=1 Tax=Lactobacillus sp. ESL0680 TaxID=2983210 RepID=UPI0023FA01FF|nr:helix-hairpin-helix domain-containing protein [Lactobacillus sp. ESL0680]WEV39371.1 helix-hairpin-helix domain-containing protein [Lactobacillus sp. ESL0680]
MNWEQIKDFILEHKQYFLVGLVVIGIVLWTHQGSRQNDTATEFTEEQHSAQKETPAKETANEVSSKQDPEPAKAKSVTCDISGAVKHQGVYTLKSSARLQELIEAAGGTTNNAELKQVNRALILQDQDKVHIPYRGEKIKANEIVTSVSGSSAATPVDSTSSTTSADDATDHSKVNLNTADAQGLQKLNGIGEKKAEQIIAYRQKNGSFKKIEDLKQVSGIGDKTFAALKDQLAV